MRELISVNGGWTHPLSVAPGETVLHPDHGACLVLAVLRTAYGGRTLHIRLPDGREIVSRGPIRGGEWPGNEDPYTPGAMASAWASEWGD